MKKAKKSSWIVRMERTIISEIVVDGCTEEQARSDPFAYVKGIGGDVEVDMIDYEVQSVRENV